MRIWSYRLHSTGDLARNARILALPVTNPTQEASREIGSDVSLGSIGPFSPFASGANDIVTGISLTLENPTLLQEGFTALEPSATKDPEAQWIRASLEGDPNAFGALVKFHERRVFRLAGRFFRRREDIEEVAQETFLTAWRKLSTYRADAPFEHWLTRICLNCCYGRLRREKKGGEALDPNLEAPQADPNARLEVHGLLRCLRPEDRFILLLLDGQGWSVAEIAERLGWSRVNVKVRAHRARKRLRKIVEEGLSS